MGTIDKCLVALAEVRTVLDKHVEAVEAAQENAEIANLTGLPLHPALADLIAVAERLKVMED